MSNNVCGFTVVLEDDVSGDRFELLKKALMLMSGVADVIPIVSSDSGDMWVHKAQEKHRIKNALAELIRNDFKI